MGRSNIRAASTWLLLIAASLAGANVEAHGRRKPAAVKLFEPLPEEKLKQVPQQDRVASRRRFVRTRADMLVDPRSPARRPRGVKWISMELFDGERLDVRLGRLDVRGSDSYTWFGWTPGEDVSEVVLTVVDGVMMGSLYRDGRAYLLRAITRSDFELMEVDVSRLPREDETEIKGESLNDVIASELIRPRPLTRIERLRRDILRRRNLRPLRRRFEAHAIETGIRILTDSGSRIDVMVAYTAEAAEAATTLRDKNGNVVDNVTDIGTLIQHVIDKTNENFAFSGVPTRVHLVREHEVAKPEPDVSSVDMLAHMTDPGGLYYDELLDAADQSRADVTTLLVRGDSGYCGRANTMTSLIDPADQAYTMGRGKNAFYGRTVVRAACGLFGFTFAHELGHAMGLKHDHFVVPTGDVGATPIGFGFVLVPPRRRTIMAYDDLCETYLGESCEVLPRFSDPYSSYDGYPLGLVGSSIIDPANSVEALKQALWTVANFRHSLMLPP